MTPAVLGGYTLLAIICAALWHPWLEAWLDRRPWWVGLGIPAVGLGGVALGALKLPDNPTETTVALSAVLGVVVAVVGGGPVTMALLRGAESSELPGLDDVPGIARPTGVELATTRFGPPVGEVLRGGAWIGILERTAITVALLVGVTEGVAIVVAVKGLARYPELRVPGASERFIIGTFASLLWAAAAVGVTFLIWR
ncbi:hypothetical protein [Flindersiella endophytica]